LQKETGTHNTNKDLAADVKVMKVDMRGNIITFLNVKQRVRILWVFCFVFCFFAIKKKRLIMIKIILTHGLNKNLRVMGKFDG
jgi:hypothetical protein